MDNWVDVDFPKLVTKIQQQISETGKYKITPKCFIFQVEEDCFRYKGEDWSTSSSWMYFKDLKKLIKSNMQVGKMNITEDVSAHVWYRQSYYIPVMTMFFQVAEPHKETTAVEKEKPFVFIIDEINRANLPAVLGELIYALEYRGSEVESLYEIEEDRKLILPENLYIIGTMNTADRSVGHIDYAIRRRFAFVDIFPEREVIKDDQAKLLFDQVQTLFSGDFLSSDFDKKDVQLGHSYFISENKDQLKLKLEYEIKPLLKEYVKDGIFLKEAELEIDKIRLD